MWFWSYPISFIVIVEEKWKKNGKWKKMKNERKKSKKWKFVLNKSFSVIKLVDAWGACG